MFAVMMSRQVQTYRSPQSCCWTSSVPKQLLQIQKTWMESLTWHIQILLVLHAAALRWIKMHWILLALIIPVTAGLKIASVKHVMKQHSSLVVSVLMPTHRLVVQAHVMSCRHWRCPMPTISSTLNDSRRLGILFSSSPYPSICIACIQGSMKANSVICAVYRLIYDFFSWFL